MTMTFRQRSLFTIAVLLALGVARPAQSGPVTYEYTGQYFNFCGFGCPANAPSDPLGADRILATITFDNPLDPNLTFADDVMSLLTGWTMTDEFGSFFNSSPSDTLVALDLETDAAGNIVGWLMVARGTTTEAGFLHPPIFCSECGDVFISDFASVNFGDIVGTDENEWDAGVASESENGLPGTWRRVPEPATLTLTGFGLAAALSRRRRKQQADSAAS